MRLVENYFLLVENHKRLYDFLEQHSILFDNQFGFRKNNSTSYALMDITEKIKVLTVVVNMVVVFLLTSEKHLIQLIMIPFKKNWNIMVSEVYFSIGLNHI